MTRRESLRVEGMPSLSKMLETYFLMARVVITSWSAIPWFDVPVAISSMTSLSRGVRRVRGLSLAATLHQCGDDLRIDDRAHLGHALHGTEELVDIADRVL